jgi:hypothetical protein
MRDVTVQACERGLATADVVEIVAAVSHSPVSVEMAVGWMREGSNRSGDERSGRLVVQVSEWARHGTSKRAQAHTQTQTGRQADSSRQADGQTGGHG